MPFNGSTIALVVAGGRGNRAGQPLPKQYVRLGGKTMLRWTLEALLSQEGIGGVQVVIGPDDGSNYEHAAKGLPRLLPPVMGGQTRQQSVRSGLEAIDSKRPRLVLVHDAARPFVSGELVARVIAACSEDCGAIPALPIAETVKRVGGGIVHDTVARESLVTAQTPQAFPFAALLAAHRSAAADGHADLTDDAAVAALAGLPVRVVAGERKNVKLTTPEDFAAAEKMLAGLTEVRTAQGFDVHAFGSGDTVHLCGVGIPHDRGLIGHSDADVGLHALTDALLGTIGDGDIGTHFPPTNPQWKGAESRLFLADAVRRVLTVGGRILHLDVTLVCEQPKIAPHREAMRGAVAAIAEVEIGRVSVKATTSEGLGFTGRGEGIAAFAIATVELPRQA